MADIFGNSGGRTRDGRGGAKSGGTSDKAPAAEKSKAASDPKPQQKEAEAVDPEVQALAEAYVKLDAGLAEFDELDPDKHDTAYVAEVFDRIIAAHHEVRGLGGSSLREKPEKWKEKFVSQWDDVKAGKINAFEPAPTASKNQKPEGGKSDEGAKKAAPRTARSRLRLR